MARRLHDVWGNPKAPVRSRGPGRRGFSLLELQVAFIVFGIALTGLFPLVATYSKAMQSLERRVVPRVPCYLVPSTSPWARKLGACACLTTQAPGPRASPPTLLVDDGDAGFAAGGGWLAQPEPGAYGGDYRAHPAGPTIETVTWQFGGLPAGWYEVQATWPEASDRATAASYSVFDGDSALGAYEVDQTSAPSGVVFGNRPWHVLATLPLGSGSARVELHSSAAGSVAADGVRLVPLQNEVRVVSLDRSLTSEEMTARVSINAEVPKP